MDRTTPKWLERKTMPFNAPWSKWEDSRFYITPAPGRRKMDPIPDEDRPKPQMKFGDGPSKERKVKWGIPFIKEPYVPKPIPSTFYIGAWKDPKTINPGCKGEIPNTTLNLWARKEHLAEGVNCEIKSHDQTRPDSVEGPPAEIHGKKGSAPNSITGVQQEFWHEWHWRNQWSLRKQTGMDKAPGGAMKIGRADRFAWPPMIMPL